MAQRALLAPVQPGRRGVSVWDHVWAVGHTGGCWAGSAARRETEL